MAKHITLAIRDVAFPIVLRIPMENYDLARDPPQKTTGNRGILDRATGPRKELAQIGRSQERFGETDTSTGPH